jgi:hypothetical protein
MRSSLRFLVAAILGLILLSGPVSAPAPQATPLTQDSTQKKAIKVWVNTNSGIYHCPGTRWYGKTKQGKFMSECEALKAGGRPITVPADQTVNSREATDTLFCAGSLME